MKHDYTLACLLVLLFPTFILAQRNCATMNVLEALKAQDPALEERIQAIERHTAAYLQGDAAQSRAVITIPVVVHVLYRTTTENISDAQIQSQIDVLNADFKALNADLSEVPGVFTDFIGKAEIEFCLAKRDPLGNASNGINRKQANRTTWGTNDRVKRASQGGIEPWDASKYLNIWVCNIGGDVLGYAQFPGLNTATDGVVIDYRYFGTVGTATAPFNKGRTTTHEVGHWLNLRHIWGDVACGDDRVDDTPTHNGANYRCPVFPHLSTCTGEPIEMTMNFMDYTDDVCMYMFSQGQVARMRAVLAPGGARHSLLSSDGCAEPIGGNMCMAPAGLGATAVTVTSAVLSWDAVSGASAYNVQLRPVGAAEWATSNTTGNAVNATNLSANTSYEFRVQTVCSSGSSSTYASTTFTTQAETSVDCTDSYESNNSRTSAKPISIGTPVRAIISTSRDDDWYKFTIDAAQPNIRVTLTSLPKDYDLRLYRNNSSVAISEEEGTTEEQIVINNASVSGTYYVRVYGYSGANDPNDCYELKVETSGNSFREIASTLVLQDAPQKDLKVVVFPNPTVNELMLDISVDADTPTNIAIFDLTGKLLQQTTTATLSNNNSIVKLNIRDLPAGVYLVRVQNGTFVSTQKFVVGK